MLRRSSSSLRSTYLDYPHLAELRRFLARIAPMRPLLVLLFGSVAKGEFTQHSDADVLVVFSKPVDWLEVYEHSDGLVQPLVKTLDEIMARIEEGDPFVIEILEDGIALHEDGGVHGRLLAAVAEAKERFGLVRTDDGWRWGK
jgi:predicted nucleotidyltransferase